MTLFASEAKKACAADPGVAAAAAAFTLILFADGGMFAAPGTGRFGVLSLVVAGTLFLA